QVLLSFIRDPATPALYSLSLHTLFRSDSDGTVTSFTVSKLPSNGILYLDAGMTESVTAKTPIPAAGNAVTLYFQPKENFNGAVRSEEHTSELQSRENLVCRLLLEKKNI